MATIKLMQHQMDTLEKTKNRNRVAYYLDMGLGKTFVGSEKLKSLNNQYNLVVCQKSKITDWVEHFEKFYPEYNILKFDKQKISDIPKRSILVINYDSVWRRSELLKLNKLEFTLMLDESQYVKNKSAKRAKFIVRQLDPSSVILLSGTPVAGKYEELWTQTKLLGWGISENKFWDEFIITRNMDIGQPFPIEIVVGYKNVDVLKQKLNEYGAIFMKTEEALTLPEQVETTINIENTSQYKKFKKDFVVTVDDKQLIGENSLTQMLYLRQLASMYNPNKLSALEDLLESSEDRFVIFYNYREEYARIKALCEKLKRPVSIINGDGTDLNNYNKQTDSITLVQYQSGASGVNLQLANKIIYFSLPLSADMYMQSMKRIHRIGQEKTCFYYYLQTKGTIDEKIYKVLKLRENYTLELFEKE